MKECYNIVPLESDEINAFNTGCTIYITRGAIEVLETDEEVEAVLAHEVAHGDAGHALLNLGMEVALPFVHVAKLIGDEVVWAWTGDMRSRLSQVIENGNLEVMLNDYAAMAPAVEIEADQAGVGILKRAGKSPDDLRRALFRLHGLDPDKISADSIDHDLGAGSDGKVRAYPGLVERLQAVDEADAMY